MVWVVGKNVHDAASGTAEIHFRDNRNSIVLPGTIVTVGRFKIDLDAMGDCLEERRVEAAYDLLIHLVTDRPRSQSDRQWSCDRNEVESVNNYGTFAFSYLDSASYRVEIEVKNLRLAPRLRPDMRIYEALSVVHEIIEGRPTT